MVGWRFRWGQRREYTVLVETTASNAPSANGKSSTTPHATVNSPPRSQRDEVLFNWSTAAVDGSIP
jgi:hypothetical protein